MCHALYEWSKKKWYKQIYLQNRNRLTDLENLWLPGGRGGIVRKFGMEMYTLLYLKWVTHKDVVCGTGNSAQCHVAAWMGEGVGGEWIHVCVWLSTFLFTWNCRNIVNRLYSNLKKKVQNKKKRMCEIVGLGLGRPIVHGVAKSQTQLSNWTE